MMIELILVWGIATLPILVFAWAEGFIDATADPMSIKVMSFHGRYPNTYKLLLLSAIIFWPIVLIVAILWVVSYLIWIFCMIFVRACYEIYDMVAPK